VTLLLDTHTLLWFLKNDLQLSAAAKTAVENPANRKVVSIVSCWEIAIQAGLGKLKLDEPAAILLSREIPANSFDLLTISLTHATAVEALPLHHKDPFDRLLVAQALAESVTLVSSDVKFDAYGIKRLW
jgi:PIN domain nuclease of toxin-antitoxin system